jgi:hypothetical protein
MNFSKLCTPAMIYFVLSVIALMMSVFTSFNIMSLVIKGFFIIVWSFFLNYLCKSGFTAISWILVLLPLILFFLF